MSNGIARIIDVNSLSYLYTKLENKITYFINEKNDSLSALEQSTLEAANKADAAASKVEVALGDLDTKADTFATDVNAKAYANTAENNAKAYVDSKGYATDVNAKAYANTAESNAKTYTNTAIGNLVTFETSVVSALPSTGTKGVIYLLPATNTAGDNIYKEYIWIESTQKFEMIGDTQISLAGYATESAAQSYANTAESNAKAYVDNKGYAAGNHNHDGVYQPVGSYAAANHGHNYAGSSYAGGPANCASILEGFDTRYGDIGWGFLANGSYTYVTGFRSPTDGGILFADKGGQTSFQIDGLFYQDEGRYMCLDSNNYGQYCTPANIGAAPASHSHKVTYGTSTPSSLADGQLYCVIES